MKKHFAVLVALACGQAHATTPQDYAYAWPLVTPGESGAWQIELTPEIYGAITDAGLRDLEVFNAAGEPVPLAAVAYDRQLVQRDEQAPLPLFDLPRPATGGGDDISLHVERDNSGRLHRLDAEVKAGATSTAVVDYLLDASAGKEPIQALQLDWDRGNDVQASFAVEGSDDLQNWRTLVASATVLDLQRSDAHLARHQIEFAPTQAHYLRLRRLDTGAALAGPKAFARWHTSTLTSVPAPRWIDLPAGKVADAATGIANAYTYSLPAALPVETARVELGSDNSIARLRLLSRDGAVATAPWQLRAEFTAFQLRQDSVVLGNDEVPISQTARHAQWRVDSSQPLDRAPKLALAYRPDRFVFLARGAGPYRLAAGSRTARRADYPVDTALASLRSRLGAAWQPPLAEVTQCTAAGGDAVLAAPAAPLPWKEWLLWGVLLLGAALVSLMALQLVRGGKDTPK
jgi:hypothetical protein